MGDSVRLLSYNIHKGIGGRDRRYRLERIMSVIDAESPDIVCLQEVDRNVRRSRFDNQPALLEEWFKPAAHMFQFNVKVQDGGYGNLVLSRWPFRERHQISLTRHQRKPRGGQLAIIETPSGPLHLAHWHLGLSERERAWQTRHVLEHYLFRQASALPTMIVGDCNDWRNILARGPFEVHGFRQITAPPLAVPVLSGVDARLVAGQGICQRSDRDHSSPRRPKPADSRRVRSSAVGHRLQLVKVTVTWRQPP